MEENRKSELNSYLSFRLSEELFALPVNSVNKILEMLPITEVPKSPDYMLGVINLRGKVLPVIDLRVKFGMPPSESTKFTSILVLDTSIDNEPVTVCVKVDSVHSVLKMNEEGIFPPPSIGSKFKAEFITGMTKIKEKFVMILDIDRVLSSDDLLSLNDIKEIKEAMTKDKVESNN